MPPLRQAWRRYFATSAPHDLASVRASLWRDDEGGVKTDPQAVIEQYKIYVEMADRVSARRSTANTFFLSLNTGVITLMAAASEKGPVQDRFLIILLLALEVQCLTWFWIIRSYRQLSAAKYVVVAAFEERLPASPYWKAEWSALGEGKDPTRYWPFTHVEAWVPALFGLTYLVSFLAFFID